MTTGGEIYLAIILAAFLTYAATLFWAMVTSGSAAPARDDGSGEPPHH
jgi:hypothetical protein